jgi:DNA-binding XRE family transcriptional regulator
MQKVNRLKVILTEKKLTNLWLARQLDVNPTTVSKWCTNSSQPDILTFLKIASLLQLDVNALYDEKVVSDISEGIGVYEL